MQDESETRDGTQQEPVVPPQDVDAPAETEPLAVPPAGHPVPHVGEGEIVDAKEIGNYYGSVAVKAEGGQFWMSVENFDGHNWEPISRRLFDAFVAEFKEPDQKTQHAE